MLLFWQDAPATVILGTMVDDDEEEVETSARAKETAGASRWIDWAVVVFASDEAVDSRETYVDRQQRDWRLVVSRS